jgi:hypothetical protein
MHECNGFAKFACVTSRRGLLCLSSQSAPFNMRVTYRSVGADEGQMRELMGYLVARNGGEAAAARMVACFPQRMLRGHLAIGAAPGIAHSPTDTSQADAIGTDGAQAESVRTGSPIAIVYSGDSFMDDAIEDIAGAIPDLSLFDRGSRAGQAASAGARRT